MWSHARIVGVAGNLRWVQNIRATRRRRIPTLDGATPVQAWPWAELWSASDVAGVCPRYPFQTTWRGADGYLNTPTEQRTPNDLLVAGTPRVSVATRLDR